MNFNHTINLVTQAVEEDVFPCAAFAIGNQKEVFVQKSVGYQSLYLEKELITPNTLFDVASASKLISTTMIALRAIELGKLCLDDKVERFFPDCYDKGNITIQSLMTHTSGIPSHIPLYTLGINKEQAVDTILKTPFDYQTGTSEVYSCMGYILLAKILEVVFGNSLDNLAKQYVFGPLGMTTATYCPTSTDIASTEYSKEYGGYLKGVVHDENARFLGGVSGNAGVFCSLEDMIQFCAMLSNKGKGFLSERMFDKAIQNYTHGFPENRGLGFLLSADKPSFAGDLFSDGSYGHTGFTGTSVMVDKDTGLYAILLTNRVHFGRENGKILRFRKQFHNSIWGSL